MRAQTHCPRSDSFFRGSSLLHPPFGIRCSPRTSYLAGDSLCVTKPSPPPYETHLPHHHSSPRPDQAGDAIDAGTGDAGDADALSDADPMAAGAEFVGPDRTRQGGLGCAGTRRIRHTNQDHPPGRRVHRHRPATNVAAPGDPPSSSTTRHHTARHTGASITPRHAIRIIHVIRSLRHEESPCLNRKPRVGAFHCR